MMPAAFLPSPTALRDPSGLVRDRLTLVAGALRLREIPVPEPQGKLLRPLLAYAFVPPQRRGELDDRFWFGALAIQMVHEASLLHDDILDDASERRGAPTLSASRGIGPALVTGDHYLTGAYRAALSTGSADFLGRFIVAVERTVAGEVRQARRAGQRMDLATYFDIVLGKSGELLGAAASLGATVLGLDRIDERAGIGRQIGALYQQIDDLLDYCALAETGKQALKDYRQRKWTWILEIAGVDHFDLSDADVLKAVFGRERHGISAAERALKALEIRKDALLRQLHDLLPADTLLQGILDGWLDAARAGVRAQIEHTEPARVHRLAAASSEAAVIEAARSVGGPEAWRGYFVRHARTFSLAARLFPAAERRKVQALYAFCRFTDDLVDEAGADVEPQEIARRLEAWTALSRAAYDGRDTGVELLDQVMSDARQAAVTWLYPGSLLKGVSMDLERSRYAGWKDLGEYTFCVAGAVGGWMSQLFGVREPRVLDQAHALGHAMQLTNIVRDVGEDLGRGRVYLPLSLLERHGLSIAELERWMRSDEALPPPYADAMEELMALADEHYAWAREGMRSLPPFFRRPVAAAAEAYRGIHREVRRNSYDNLRLRARTSTTSKLYLAAIGLMGANRLVAAEVGPVARLAS
jgi:phytoene synthase